MSSTLLFSDGWDAYNSSSGTIGLLNTWTSINGFVPGLAAGRYGGQCVQLVGTGNRLQRSFTATGTFVSRMALRFDTLPNSTTHTISLLTGATFQVSIRFTTTGAIEAYRATSQTAGTLLGSSAAGVVLTNTWQSFEFLIGIGNAAGYVTVRVDGVTVLTLTGVDTQNDAAITTVNVIQIGGTTAGGNITTSVDDLDVRTGTTSPGQLRISTLYPSADTAQKDWAPNAGTTNYTQIDEAQVSVADYVQAGVVGNLDIYDFTDLPALAFSRIDEVVMNCNALKTDAVARAIALPVKSNATQIDGPNLSLLTTSAFPGQNIVALDPDGGAPWTQAKVNAMQAGLKVTI